MKLRREYMRGDETVTVIAERLEGDTWRVRVGERVIELTAQALGDGGVRLAPTDSAPAGASIAYGAAAGKEFMVRNKGRTWTLSPPAARGVGATGGGGTITAPMTGTVLEVRCKPGDQVAADQTLVVLSAMKMEHKLAAGIAGTVQSVTAIADATVDQGAELVIVQSEDGE